MTNWEFRAGAGKSCIAYPPELFPLKDGPLPIPFTGVHDNPYVRVLVLEYNIRFVLVSIEMVIFPETLKDQMKAVLTEKTEAAAENIWIMATHSIMTPHLWGEEWLNTPEDQRKAQKQKQNLLNAAARAAAEAVQKMETATIGYGCGICAANVSRMIETCDGWWNGSGEEGVVDRSVPVIRIDSAKGKPIAVLYNYNAEMSVMEGAVMPDGGRHITADLCGAASDFLEQEYQGEITALFLPGISTDQVPAYRTKRVVRGRNGAWTEKNIHERGYLLLELLGERLGEQVLVTMEKIRCGNPAGPIAAFHRHFWFPGQKQTAMDDIRPAKVWIYEGEKERTAAVEVLTFGDLVFVSGNQICIRTAMKIKEQSPFSHTVIVSCVTGQAEHLSTDGIKYMAEEDLYDKITFQSRNSSFGKGAAEEMLIDVTEYLQEIYEQVTR